jgi:hypothetical protein
MTWRTLSGAGAGRPPGQASALLLRRANLAAALRSAQTACPALDRSTHWLAPTAPAGNPEGQSS